MPGNTVVGKDVVLIGQDFLAHYLDVTTQTISNWYSPRRGLTGMPAPLYVHFAPGKPPKKVWHTAQLPAWDRWFAKHTADTGKHIPKRNRRLPGLEASKAA